MRFPMIRAFSNRVRLPRFVRLLVFEVDDAGGVGENGGVKEKVDTWICPECGAEVMVGASGCPRCLKAGRKMKRREKTGGKRSWEQDEASDGLSLPDDDFDYEEFVKGEFGSPHERIGIPRLWWWTALILVLLLGLLWVGGKFGWFA